jgi:hypothetical protein
VIQFMGNTVTVATLGKARHHAGRMRNAMTALAGWYCLVFVFMAGHTQNCLMFGIAAGKHLEGPLMAGGAHLIRCIGCHEHRSWHVGLMALLAFCGHHIRTVRFMALGTERYLAMNIVAETAGKIGMLTLDLFQFNDLLGMTGKALFGDIVGKFDNLGGMGIVMAAQTTGQIIVGLAGMALAADRNNLFHRWRMAGMTILAGDTCLMGTAVCCYVSRWGHVTFDTVSTGQHRPVGSKRA